MSDKMMNLTALDALIDGYASTAIGRGDAQCIADARAELADLRGRLSAYEEEAEIASDASAILSGLRKAATMSDLKPGYVRVFQCEECGEFLFPGNLNACHGRYHTRRIDGSDYDCGPITERILADPDVVRRETIDECVTVISNNTPWDRCHGCEVNLYAKLRALADAPRETESDGGG